MRILNFILDNNIRVSERFYLEELYKRIGILEIYRILQNTFKKQKKTIVFCIVRVMATLWILILKFIADEVFGMIGNSGEYLITPIGYIVMILSWVILGLQITQNFLMKKGM